MLPIQVDRRTMRHPQNPAARKIIAYVSDAFQITPGLLVNGGRPFVDARHIAMWLCRKQDMSTPEIGRALGGVHHTSVLHALTKVDLERVADGKLQAFLDRALAEFPQIAAGRMRVPVGKGCVMCGRAYEVQS